MATVVARLTLPEYVENHLLCTGANIVCESGLGHFAKLMIKDGIVQVIVRHPTMIDPEIRVALDGAVAITAKRISEERNTRICGRCHGSGKFTWSDQETPPNGIERKH